MSPYVNKQVQQTTLLKAVTEGCQQTRCYSSIELLHLNKGTIIIK